MQNNHGIYILEDNNTLLLVNYIFGATRKIYPDKREKIIFEKTGQEKRAKTIGNPNCDSEYLREIYETALLAGTNAVLLTETSSGELRSEMFCGNKSCGMWSKKCREISIQPIKIVQGSEYVELYKIPSTYLDRFPEIASIFFQV